MFRLRCSVLLLFVALAGGCGKPIQEPPSNLLLITIETTRADHVSAYGYGRQTTPMIDQLARQGALFERAYTVSPRTNPSLASLLTSRYPQEHGVRTLLTPVSASNLMLAEMLRRSGYRTAAVQAHPRLTKDWSGFDQGFETYDDQIGHHPYADPACARTAALIKKLSRTGRPWFVWLHLMDPHWIYYPPDPRVRYLYGPPDARVEDLYKTFMAGKAEMGDLIFRNRMPADEVRNFINLYDAELKYTDAAVGKLMHFLSSSRLADRTVIILTADHGESLGEHDYFFEHGDFGTEPEIHVPLIVVASGRIRPGVRVRSTVRSIDIIPTVMDLLKISKTATDLRGESLLPLINRPTDRYCMGETGENYFPQNERREVKGIAGKWRWILRGQFKLLYIPHASGPPERRLFDLQSDPAESADVSASHPEVFQDLSRRLDQWVSEDLAGSHKVDVPVSPDVREHLRSLGYVD